MDVRRKRRITCLLLSLFLTNIFLAKPANAIDSYTIKFIDPLGPIDGSPNAKNNSGGEIQSILVDSPETGILSQLPIPYMDWLNFYGWIDKNNHVYQPDDWSKDNLITSSTANFTNSPLPINESVADSDGNIILKPVWNYVIKYQDISGNPIHNINGRVFADKVITANESNVFDLNSKILDIPDLAPNNFISYDGPWCSGLGYGDSYNLNSCADSAGIIKLIVNSAPIGDVATISPSNLSECTNVNSLKNGSFEFVPSNLGWRAYGIPKQIGFVDTDSLTETELKNFCWHTSESDGKIELQRQVNESNATDNSGTSTFPFTDSINNIGVRNTRGQANFDDAAAIPVDGNYYAEINANDSGMLYQDISTTPGEKLKWTISHKGRTSAYNFDSMHVEIGDANNQTINSYSQRISDSQDLVANTPTSFEYTPYNARPRGFVETWKSLSENVIRNALVTLVGRSSQLQEPGSSIVSSPNPDVWGVYSGTYVVPEGQTLTRFGFVSDSAGAIGNLLDNVSFSRFPEITWNPISSYSGASGSATLTSATSQSDAPAIYKVTNSGSANCSLSGLNLTWTSTGTCIIEADFASTSDWADNSKQVTLNFTENPSIDLYIDEPLVQGSYAAGAGVLTENFNSLPHTNSYTENAFDCNNLHLTVGNVEGLCTIFESGTALGSSSQLSDPAYGNATSQGISDWPGSQYVVPSYTIKLSSDAKYLGFWWSTGNAGNTVNLLKNGQVVATVTTDDVLNTLGNPNVTQGEFQHPTVFVESLSKNRYPSIRYHGNPAGFDSLTPQNLSTQDLPGEIFAYLHFFAQGSTSFDAINFSGPGFEIDNLTTSTDPIPVDPRVIFVRSYSAFSTLSHTLTYNSDSNGSISGNTSQSVEFGADGSAVTAVPDAGYHFVKWSDESTANSRTDLNVIGDITVSASFELDAPTTHTLHYSAGPNGSISGSASQTVNNGADGSAVTAIPDAGYHFVQWSDESTANPRTDLNVIGDITVSASFAATTITPTFTSISPLSGPASQSITLNGTNLARGDSNQAYGYQTIYYRSDSPHSLSWTPVNGSYIHNNNDGTLTVTLPELSGATRIEFHIDWCSNLSSAPSCIQIDSPDRPKFSEEYSNYIYTINIFNVNINNRDATISQSNDGSTSYTPGNPIVNIPSSAPIKDGNYFLGWFTSSSGGTQVTNSSYIPAYPYGDVTLYAHWAPIMIDFQANGGIFDDSTTLQQALRLNSEPYYFSDHLPRNPTFAGKEFLGWSYDGINVLNPAFYFDSRITVLATWGEFDATFDANDGTFPGGLNVAHSSLLPNGFDAFRAAPPNPVREHFIFAGWALNTDSNNNLISTYSINSDVTFKAVWIPGFRATFMSGTGYFPDNDTLKVTGYQPAGFDVLSVIEDPVNNSLAFDGWSLIENGEKVLTYPLVDSDVTFYPLWTQGFRGSFDPKGGNWSGVTAVQQSIYKKSGFNIFLIAPQSNPTKENFTFGGWKMSSSSDSTPITRYSLTDSDVTFDAIWTPNESGGSSGSGSGSGGYSPPPPPPVVIELPKTAEEPVVITPPAPTNGQNPKPQPLPRKIIVTKKDTKTVIEIAPKPAQKIAIAPLGINDIQVTGLAKGNRVRVIITGKGGLNTVIIPKNNQEISKAINSNPGSKVAIEITPTQIQNLQTGARIAVKGAKKNQRVRVTVK